jgi:hypothetical protein
MLRRAAIRDLLAIAIRGQCLEPLEDDTPAMRPGFRFCPILQPAGAEGSLNISLSASIELARILTHGAGRMGPPAGPWDAGAAGWIGRPICLQPQSQPAMTTPAASASARL